MPRCLSISVAGRWVRRCTQSRVAGALLLYVLASLAVNCNLFIYHWCVWPRSSTRQIHSHSAYAVHDAKSGGSHTRLRASSPDSPSPEAWRDFRAQLVAGGLKLTTDENPNDTVGGNDGESASSNAIRRSVAPKNEELLLEQNKELWSEYINGAWAHPGIMEAGTLLCRLPLEGQLMYLMRQGSVGETTWGQKLREQLVKELPEAEAGRSKDELFETWSRNTPYCYRLAENMVKKELGSISQKAIDGRLNVRKLSKPEQELIMMYSRAGEEYWQAVCLVLSTKSGSSTDAQEAIMINRPCAKRIDAKFANLLLNGAEGAVNFDEETVEACERAFGLEAAVYMGGPEKQGLGGLLVHGFEDLPGAEEISPGTRIYTGGVRAAIDGVLNGKFKPLDFRWFVGRHTDLSTRRGGWSAVACARPICLKQCLGLPKPLWHEVMQLCGGENAALSRLEFVEQFQEDPDTDPDTRRIVEEQRQQQEE